MPRTSIPQDLIHRPEEVERNAQRFDQLCRLAEEVALPVVKRALVREAAATGAEAFADEAKTALRGLVDEAVLDGVQDAAVLDRLRQSLEEDVPEPDEEEWLALTRDTAQILMSVWLETLRGALAKKPILHLSDFLLPLAPPNVIQRFLSFSFIEVRPRPDIPRSVSEPVAALPMTEEETGEIMSTFRAKLFSESRSVELPFDLVIAGAPHSQALAMHRSTYDHLMDLARQHAPTQNPFTVEPSDVGGFETADAQFAMASLSAKMPKDTYESLLQEAKYS